MRLYDKGLDGEMEVGQYQPKLPPSELKKDQQIKLKTSKYEKTKNILEENQ